MTILKKTMPQERSFGFYPYICLCKGFPEAPKAAQGTKRECSEILQQYPLL